jgi:SAM-dependent methyltransferase
MTPNLQERYTDGTYLKDNPTWHEEDAPFKAKYIKQIIEKNGLQYRSVLEIGCGIGSVVTNVAKLINDPTKQYTGCDISAEAINIAKTRWNGDVEFVAKDIADIKDVSDILLCIDVFEHVPDYLGFLQKCQKIAKYKIYHIPLDLHVSGVLRDSMNSIRHSVGHLHYFSKRTAIATLEDSGHEIIDYVLTPGALELYKMHPSIKRAVANVPRWVTSKVSAELSTRIFGGHSLLVLAK